MIHKIESTVDLPGKRDTVFSTSQHKTESAAREYAGQKHPGLDGYLRKSQVLASWYLFVPVEKIEL